MHKRLEVRRDSSSNAVSKDKRLGLFEMINTGMFILPGCRGGGGKS